MPPLAPRRGEIWSVWTPGQPRDPHQPRPALVVSDDVRNRFSDDVTVIPIFSSQRLGPTRVPITKGTGGLAHDSLLFCEEITTLVHDFLVSGPLGPLVSEALLRRAIRAVRRALGDVLPE
ncbi:MAG TPA: type II toxin-antitoxin system PemK/MazF family toxin [Chloroflexota bacterium]